MKTHITFKTLAVVLLAVCLAPSIAVSQSCPGGIGYQTISGIGRNMQRTDHCIRDAYRAINAYCGEGGPYLTPMPGPGPRTVCCHAGDEGVFKVDESTAGPIYYCKETPEPDPEPIVDCNPEPGELRILRSVIDIDYAVDNGNLTGDVDNELRISCLEGRRPLRDNCYKYPGSGLFYSDEGCCANGYTLTTGYPCRDGQACPDKLTYPILGYCAPNDDDTEVDVSKAQLPESLAAPDLPTIGDDECVRLSWLFVPDKVDKLPPIVVGIGDNPEEIINSYVGFFTNKCTLGALVVNSLLCTQLGFGPGSGKLDECLFITTAFESCFFYNTADALDDTSSISDPIQRGFAFLAKFAANMLGGTAIVDTVIDQDFQGFDDSFTGPACLAGSVAYDDKCNVILGETPADCAHVFVYGDLATPVSLLWDGSKRLVEDPVVRMFELEPGNPQWVSWKASEKAPLLVHTPNGETEITSATQLFGSSSFGRTFSTGFEALASLDKDGNGVLQADELSDISLWFDKNRDAVSQPGEVVSLNAAGVTELFFNADVNDTISGDMYATVGYTRQVGDKVEQGTSVDWFSQGSSSKEEIEKIVTSDVKFEDFTETRKRLLGEGKQAPPAYSKKHLELIAKILHGLEERDKAIGFEQSPVAGVWNWQIADKNIHPQFRDKVAVGGSMIFVENPDGRINGFVQHESPGIDAAGRPQHVVTKLPAYGKMKENSRREFSFAVSGPSEPGVTSKTENTVTLGKSGEKLYGASVTTKTFKDGKTKEFRYNWVATRMNS